MVLSYKSLTDWTLLYQTVKSFKLFTNKVNYFNLFNHLGISLVYSACIWKVSTVYRCSNNSRLDKVKVKCVSALCRCVYAGYYLRLCGWSVSSVTCRCGCHCQNVFSAGLKLSSLFDPFLGVRLMACCRQALLSPLLCRESSYSLLSAAAAHKDTFLASSY